MSDWIGKLSEKLKQRLTSMVSQEVLNKSLAGKGFGTGSNLRRHMRLHPHNDNSKRKFCQCRSYFHHKGILSLLSGLYNVPTKLTVVYRKRITHPSLVEYFHPLLSLVLALASALLLCAAVLVHHAVDRVWVRPQVGL